MQNVDINLDLTVDRTLSLQWIVSEDSYTFHVYLIDKPSTRRGVLSTASSLYDPLGFVAPVTLLPKLILQSFDGKWDDPLDCSKEKKWHKWKEQLKHLEDLRIPRCYFKQECYSPEMHVFSDASELAYGAVIYLRLSSTPPKLAFVTGKSRVAPKKTVSIPRLELNAAAIACKLADSVKTNLRIKPVSTTFWTDSIAVLRFINNTRSRFKVFVANRLSIIHEFTTPSQWQYVKTEENPADLASRGVSPDDLNAFSSGSTVLISSFTPTLHTSRRQTRNRMTSLQKRHQKQRLLQ